MAVEGNTPGCHPPQLAKLACRSSPEAAVIPGNTKGCVLWVHRQMLMFKGPGESCLLSVSRTKPLAALGGVRVLCGHSLSSVCDLIRLLSSLDQEKA